VNFSAKYGYDAKGNLVKFEETYGGKFRAIEMTYDAFDRLTDEYITDNGMITSNHYEYDNSGNRLSFVTKNGEGVVTKNVSYEYNEANQLLSEISLPYNSETLYSYDDCGNLMSKLEAYAMYPTLYYYDLRNRLGYVSKSTSMYDFIKYTLDSRGRRTALYQYYGAYPTKDINMSYSGGTSVYERDHVMNGMDLIRDVTQIFYRGSDYGGGVGGLLYAGNLDGSDLNYKHYNLRGDVIQTTADNGTIKSNMYYTAFGSINETGTPPTDSFRSNTKYVDSFGIINEGFRCRQTNSDRFLTPDPLEYVDGLNQYLYCAQNPWGRFDALGLKLAIKGNADDVKAINMHLEAIAKINPEQGAAIEALRNSKNTHTIFTPRSDKKSESLYKKDGPQTISTSRKGNKDRVGSDTFVIYDPLNRREMIDENGTTLFSMHPLQILSHELQHASDRDSGDFNGQTNLETGQSFAEDRAISTENKVAVAIGEETRKYHDGVKEANFRFEQKQNIVSEVEKPISESVEITE